MYLFWFFFILLINVVGFCKLYKRYFEYKLKVLFHEIACIAEVRNQFGLFTFALLLVLFSPAILCFCLVHILSTVFSFVWCLGYTRELSKKGKED